MSPYNVTALNDHLVFVKKHSPYYRQLWQSVWKQGDQVPTLETLPITEHVSYWQANNVLDNQLLTAPHDEGIVFKSGGTTGSPKFSYFSNADWRAFCRVFGNGMRRGGLKEGDRVANIFYGGQLYASLLFIGGAIAEAGCGVNYPIAGFAPAEDIVDAVELFQINTLAGVPTSIMNLLPRLAQRGSSLKLERIIFGGEAMYPDQISLIKSSFPDCQVQSIGIAGVDYGEMGWVDDSCPPGVHRVYDESTVLEILDDNDRPLDQPGDEGALCITNYVRRLMPVIRYAVGDRGTWIDPPGVPGRRFKVLGRTAKGARIGPMTLYMEDIQCLLEKHCPQGAFETFQVIVTHENRRDRCTLRISCPSPPDDVATLNEQLAEALYRERHMFHDLIKDGVVHPLTIEWVAPDKLETNPRTGKLMRLIDRRSV
jgi:phenylacetate-CoA ligase